MVQPFFTYVTGKRASGSDGEFRGRHPAFPRIPPFGEPVSSITPRPGESIRKDLRLFSAQVAPVPSFITTRRLGAQRLAPGSHREGGLPRCAVLLRFENTDIEEEMTNGMNYHPEDLGCACSASSAVALHGIWVGHRGIDKPKPAA